VAGEVRQVVSSTQFQRALKAAQRWVGSVDGVVMVAEGLQDGEPVIDVFVTPPAARRSIPAQEQGVPVTVYESDEFVALDEQEHEEKR
jgi:hypothetical protein